MNKIDIYNNFRFSAIDCITKEIEIDENKYFKSVKNAEKLIKKYSPKSKDYYFSLSSIFKNYFKIDSLKIEDNFIEEYLYSCLNRSDKRIIYNNFNISIFEDENIFIQLARENLANRKGVAVLYPLLNLKDENNLDINIPIDLRFSQGEEYRIYDFYYFKKLITGAGGTHRTVGICNSIGLLQDCSIKMDYITFYDNAISKKQIDNLNKFIKQIDGNKNIDSFQYHELSIYKNIYNVKFLLKNNVNIIIEKITLQKLVLIELELMINLINSIEIEEIIIKDLSISFKNKGFKKYFNLIFKKEYVLINVLSLINETTIKYNNILHKNTIIFQYLGFKKWKNLNKQYSFNENNLESFCKYSSYEQFYLQYNNNRNKNLKEIVKFFKENCIVFLFIILCVIYFFRIEFIEFIKSILCNKSSFYLYLE